MTYQEKLTELQSRAKCFKDDGDLPLAAVLMAVVAVASTLDIRDLQRLIIVLDHFILALIKEKFTGLKDDERPRPQAPASHLH